MALKWLSVFLVLLLAFTFISCATHPVITVPVQPEVFNICAPPLGESQAPEVLARGHAYNSHTMGCT